MRLCVGHEKRGAILSCALILFLILLLLSPISSFAEEDGDDWWDWRADWEEEGRFAFCDVDDDTLIIKEGVISLSMFPEDQEDADEIDVYNDDYYGIHALNFDRSFDPPFRRVSFPSTLRKIGEESFIAYAFDTFTLPSQLEVLEEDAFVYCHFDVLRIESDLPVEVILKSVYDCTVEVWDVPEDHPQLKAIDGVLFSKDGKTLINYPNGRSDTHYDVPRGVEEINDIHNENLQTISLPIGLKTVDDYGFSGCTRLQAISLPLTVQSLGENIFDECVSLELVSLPNGMEADKDLDEVYAVYYTDDALYRGDNGNTSAGIRSFGRIDAPGRLGCPDSHGFPVYSTITGKRMRILIPIYDASDDTDSSRYYYQGKTVYMGEYEKGRVALYEPLGGTYAAADGYGSALGWAELIDVEYLSPQALFEYAEVKPRGTMSVWWNHLPDQEYWTPWETVIPLEGRNYKPTLFGAFVRFDDPVTHSVFGCAIQDVELTRVPDGTDHVYGIVFNSQFLEDVTLYLEPGFVEYRTLAGGTQVRIREEEDGWFYVADGEGTSGWVEQDHVLIIPEKQEEEE